MRLLLFGTGRLRFCWGCRNTIRPLIYGLWVVFSFKLLIRNAYFVVIHR